MKRTSLHSDPAQQRAWRERSKGLQRTGRLRPRAKAKTEDAVKVYKDRLGNVLREVCQNNDAGDAEYKRRTKAMFDRQGGICALSGKPMRWTEHPREGADCTFDHETPRGLGGAWRDDRIEVNGAWQNAAVRWDENTKKGSSRVPYLDFARGERGRA